MPETEREKRMIRGKGALSLNSIADVWKNVLDRLRSQLSETTINTWFDEVEVVTMEDSAFVLHCSNSFKKSTIEARFMSHIKAALKDIFSSDLEVKILDDQQLSAYHGVARLPAGVRRLHLRHLCGGSPEQDGLCRRPGRGREACGAL